MKLIKMKFILALIFICNITSLQVQLDEGLPFYNTFNDQLLKAKLSFADSKKNVENIYSLKSDEKSRVLILARARAGGPCFQSNNRLKIRVKLICSPIQSKFSGSSQI